jgi:hypothetical protein
MSFLDLSALIFKFDSLGTKCNFFPVSLAVEGPHTFNGVVRVVACLLFEI